MTGRSELPAFLIGMHDCVEGMGRLQKYAFLSAMQIKELRSVGFYDDWKASNFGPFSAGLAGDIREALGRSQITRHTITNSYGFRVDRFAVTGHGRKIFERLRHEHAGLYNKIVAITGRYQEYSLARLLQDVYYRYPQYASAGTTKAGRGIYESDSYLNTEHDGSGL